MLVKPGSASDGCPDHRGKQLLHRDYLAERSPLDCHCAHQAVVIDVHVVNACHLRIACADRDEHRGTIAGFDYVSHPEIVNDAEQRRKQVAYGSFASDRVGQDWTAQRHVIAHVSGKRGRVFRVHDIKERLKMGFVHE